MTYMNYRLIRGGIKIFYDKFLNINPLIIIPPPLIWTYDVMEAYESSELGIGVRFPLSPFKNNIHFLFVVFYNLLLGAYL